MDFGDGKKGRIFKLCRDFVAHHLGKRGGYRNLHIVCRPRRVFHCMRKQKDKTLAFAFLRLAALDEFSHPHFRVETRFASRRIFAQESDFLRNV